MTLRTILGEIPSNDQNNDQRLDEMVILNAFQTCFHLQVLRYNQRINEQYVITIPVVKGCCLDFVLTENNKTCNYIN